MDTEIKNIHIGAIISQRVKECNIDIDRMCRFLKCTEYEIEKIYECKSIDSMLLLKYSKLLEYDFFRLYSQHLILYSPPISIEKNITNKNITSSALPQFRKNLYTKDLIQFILELIETNKKTKFEIISEYNIPKTTLYKWIQKYKNDVYK